MRHILFSAVLILAALPGARASAAVPESVWEAVKERSVVLQRVDGSESVCQILSVGRVSAVAQLPDGQIIELKKSDVSAIRAAPAEPAGTAEVSAWTRPPGEVAAPGLPEAPLVTLVRMTPEQRLPDLVRTDTRFQALDDAARARLVESTKQHRVGLGIALNTFVGFGVGSFVQGDRGAGTLLLVSDIAGMVLLYSGLFTYVAGVDEETAWGASPDAGQHKQDLGARLMVAGGVTFLATRIIGIIRPTTFHGRKYDILKREFARSGVEASFYAAPRLASAGGEAGIVVRF